MGWFNYYGLVFIVILMIPNVVYAVKNKNGFIGVYHNKRVEFFEQAGRFGCFALMIFNIPYTWVGFWFSYGKEIYLVVNTSSVLAYCLIWIILRNNSDMVKALLLSIIPSLMFVFSGITIASIPLFIFSVVFAVCHILISVKNSASDNNSPRKTRRKSAVTVFAVLLSFVFVIIGTFGCIILNGQNNLAKLDYMSAREMIDYCLDKDSKISVALIENGNVSYHTYCCDGEKNVLYDFEIGSISKTFVGLLCAKAVNENKLNITDCISKYLDLDASKYYPTIERLLTHTSGYEAYYFENRMIGNKLAHISNDFYGISKDKILSKIKELSLEDKDYPFEYSNFGISVLGLVLEKIYKEDFTKLVNGYIIDELKLTNTKVAKQSGNLYNYWKWEDNDGYVPAGAIVSNVEDMAKYLNVFLSDGLEYASDTYAKIKDINANNKTYEKMNIRLDGVGMTWMLDDKNDIVWHNGATTNFNAYMGFTKDKKKGVAVLSNIDPDDKISMTVIGVKILTSASPL